MNWNIVCISGGLSVCLFGLYRQFPVIADQKFYLQWVPLAVLCILCAGFLYWKGGASLLSTGLAATGKVSTGLVPVLVLILPMMGFGAAAAVHYRPEIKALLEGKQGIFGAFLAACLSPTSQSLSGVVTELWSVPSLRPILLYSLIASPLVSLNIFMIRQAGLGWNISLKMYGASFVAVLALMPVFWFWVKIGAFWL